MTKASTYMEKTKRQDGWATNLIGWANPMGWFGGTKSSAGVTLQPPGAATRGSGAIEGRNPYDYYLPGYGAFNGAQPHAGIPGMAGMRWPGSYATYRIMMTHPTVALTRASVFSPILAGSWTYEADAEGGDDGKGGSADVGRDEDPKDFIHRVLDKKRQGLLLDCLRCLDFGFQAFEIVWGRDANGMIVPESLKPLLPELTEIVVDENGNVTSLTNGGATLNKGEFLLVNYDVEGSNHYGRSRLENVRRAWANYLAIEDQGYLLDKKASGTIPIIYYPSDTVAPTSGDPNASSKSNMAAARAMAHAIQDHKGIVVENFAGLASDMTPEMLASLAGKSDYVIDVKDFGNVGPSQAAILEKLRYYDQMLVRGYLRSERSVIEANTAGSRADSETHTASISDTDCDLVHAHIVDQINRQLVDEMLVQNFGEAARGTVWIAIREIVDERRATMDKLLQAALSDPMMRGELFERIDMDSLCQWTGIKMREDAKPFDEMPTQEDRQEQEVEKAAALHEATGGDVEKLSRETIMLSMENERDGHWVTLNGAHVFIGGDGRVSKGPSHMTGKTISEIGGKAEPDIASLAKHKENGFISNSAIKRNYGNEVHRKVHAEIARMRDAEIARNHEKAKTRTAREVAPEVPHDDDRLTPYIESLRETRSADLSEESTPEEIAAWQKKVLSSAKAAYEADADAEHQKAIDQEREESDFKRWKATKAAMDSHQSVVEKEIGAKFTRAEGGSRYADYRGLKLRISDHEQVPGGGFNSTTGERMGEADVSWVIDPDDEPPTPAQIRSAVAKALKKIR